MKKDTLTNVIILLCLLGCTAIMAVYPPLDKNDETIYQAIQEKIATDPFLQNEKIRVASSQGNVKFSGLLHSKQQLSHIVTAAATTNGVQEVDTSALMVEQSAASK